MRGAFGDAHVLEPHYWVAAHPGAGATIPPGAIAHQYADTGPVDLSVVADYWPGVDPPPIPTSKEPLRMPRVALPATAMPLKQWTDGWKPDGSQYDVTMLGADGHLYRISWSAGVWSGPEDLTAAG